MRVRWPAVVVGFVIVSACAGRAPNPSTPTPAAAETPPRSPGVEAITLVRPAAMLPDTGAVAEMRRAAMERSAEAARRVASISIPGDSIRLAVGERVGFLDFRAIGRDSSGAVVGGFAPRLSIANQDIVRFDQGGLLGLSVGRTVLRVAAAPPRDTTLRARPPVQIEVPVIVTPSTSSLRTTEAVTDSVPRDLVLALLGAGRRPAALRVGAAADGVPADVVAGWIPMGSVSYGPTSTSVFKAPYASRVAVDSLVARFGRDGWTRPPERSSMLRGFVSTGMMAVVTPDVFCLDGHHAAYSASSRLPNESHVLVHLTANHAQCNRSSTKSRFESMMDSMPIPRLFPPANLTVEGGGTGSSGSAEWNADAKATGMLGVGETLRHYAEQLVTQGWTADGLTGSGTTLAVQGFRRDFQGRSWWAILSVSAPGPGVTPGLLLNFRLNALSGQ